jgi:hypothetical protein
MEYIVAGIPGSEALRRFEWKNGCLQPDPRVL